MKASAWSVFTLLFLAFVMPAHAQVQWDMATPYADSEFHTQNIRMFAQDIEKATNGQLKIVVHSGGSLYKMPQIKPAVQSGQVPLGEIVLSFLANEDPVYDADWLLFLAPGYADALRLWDAQRPAVEQRFAKLGIKVLYAVPWPPQALFTKRPVESLANLKGMKLRTYNKATAKIAEGAGATPVQIEAAEMTQAFATGVVEGLITSPSSAYNNKLYEFLKYGYDVRASLPKDVVMVNAKMFGALNAKVQSAVLDAAAKAQKRGWEMSEKETATRVAQLREKGMEFREPTAALMKDFRDIGARLTEDWRKSAGPSGDEILKKYRAK
jgi:TRAP-type transport system periplasmic protein